MLEPVELSDSQIKNFQRCPRRWAYEKLLKLDPVEDKDNLTLGSGVHDALELFVKERKVESAIAEAMKVVKAGNPTNREWQLRVVPAMVTGYITHHLPVFEQEFEIVAVEEWFTSLPHPEVKIRGYKDVRAKSRSTGRISVWDYKTTGMSGGGDLGDGVAYNNQLARYAVSEKRHYGEWPEEVGLIFISKPKKDKGGDIAKDVAKCNDPTMYFQRRQRVTPQFAAFALGVEASDVLYGQQMLAYRETHKQHGVAALDFVPANLNACSTYGTLCGFAGGCHQGRPAHTLIKTP